MSPSYIALEEIAPVFPWLSLTNTSATSKYGARGKKGRMSTLRPPEVPMLYHSGIFSWFSARYCIAATKAADPTVL